MLGTLRRAAYDRLHGLSLTHRLVAVVVLLVLAAYLLTTSVTMMLLRGYLVDRVDSDLHTYSQPLADTAYAAILQASGESALGRQQTFIPPSPYYVLVTPADDEVQSFALVYAQVQTSPPQLQRGEIGDQRLGVPFTVPAIEGDGNWRVLARSAENPQGVHVGTVTVALSLDNIDSTVRQLGQLLAGIGLVTLVIVGVLGWFAVRRAFRPLTRIEDTAAAIAAGDLTRRLPPPGANDEVGSLSESLNSMLAQIEQSFGVQEDSEQRMRDFVADASHELRTPLATIKGYAELHRFGALSAPDDVAGAMLRIEGEASRMSQLVEDLLTLTRLDSDPPMSPTRVDLTVLASDVVQDARVRAPDRQVRLVSLEGANGVDAPVVFGEDGALRQVLTNLVANALAHTAPGTPVEVALGSENGSAGAGSAGAGSGAAGSGGASEGEDPKRAGDTVVLEVRDHGQGLAHDVTERVFERFYRADKSRSRASGGTGLGLAIVAAIVARHRGSVHHRPTPSGGATFRVELPAASPSGGDD